MSTEKDKNIKEEGIKDCLPRYFLLTLRDYDNDMVKNFIKNIDHNAKFISNGIKIRKDGFEKIDFKNHQVLFVETKYLTEEGLESIKGIVDAIELPDPIRYKN